MPREIVCIDVETNHLLPSEGVILQITAAHIDMETGKNISRFNTYIQPYDMEPTERGVAGVKGYEGFTKAMGVNKIKLSTLEKAPSPISVIAMFHDWFHASFSDKVIPLGQNYAFDKSFLRLFFGEESYSKYFSHHYLDTAIIAQHLRLAGHLPMLESLGLGKMCDYFNINHKAHDSTGDVYATIEIYKRLLTMSRGYRVDKP